MFKTRASIAGLMGIVVVAALGLTALRADSPTWASVIFLLTCGVLASAIVGAVCGPPGGRAWWVGFSVFGWGYLALAFWHGYDGYSTAPALPTIRLLRILTRIPAVSVTIRSGFHPTGFLHEDDDQDAFGRVGHCLWSLAFAVLGGGVASVLFPVPPSPPVPLEEKTPRTDRASPRWRRTRGAAGILGLVLYLVVALAGSRTAPGLWAGVTVLITRGVLGLLIVGAVFRRGKGRPRWLGAAVFGVGYLMSIPANDDDPTWPHHATDLLLADLQPWLPTMVVEDPPATQSIAQVNTRIVRTLDRIIPMRFPEATPLEEVLAYVVAETRDPAGRRLSIHVDPIGLQEAEKTMKSPVTLDLDGVPLRTTLKLALYQLGMLYFVKDGLVQITAMRSGEEDYDRPYADPYLVLGQCVLTWLAAGLGSVLAPLAAGTRPDSAG